MNAERAALFVAALLTAALATFAVMAPSDPDAPDAVPRASPEPVAEPRVAEPRAAEPTQRASRPPLAQPPPLSDHPPAPPSPIAVEELAAGAHTRPVVAGELVFVFGPIPRAEAEARLADAGFTLRTYTPSIGAALAALPPGWRVADGLEHARVHADLPPAAPNAIAWGADAGDLHALDNAALHALLAQGDGAMAYAARPERPRDDAPCRARRCPADDVVDPWAPPTRLEVLVAQIAVRLENIPFTRAIQAAFDDAHRDDPIVAVVDSGVVHQSAVLPWGAFIRFGIVPWVSIVGGHDFVRDHHLALDENQHGTHVASTIVRTSGGRVRLMPLKVLDRLSIGTEYDVARGMLHAAEHGADIINLSLTFGRHYVPSPLFAEVLDRCQQADVLIIAAAGNDAAETVTYPAALRGIIAVGADRPDEAVFANHGAALDLVAPAGGVDPDDDGVLGASFELYRPTRPGLVRLSGTSMASAAATGEIAAIMHALRAEGLLPDGPPGTRVDFLRDVITQSAAPLGDAPFDPTWGMGAVDADAAIALADRLVTDDLVTPTTGERIGVAAQTSVFLEQTTVDGAPALGGVAVVEALGPDGRPLVGATLYGDWEGSASGPATCVTDDWGRCVITSTPTALPDGDDAGVLFGLTLHRALTAETAYDIRPAERYHAARAATTGHITQTLQSIARADDLDADTLALLDEVDPITGDPVYCLGDTCPGYMPELGGADDLFRIDHQRVFLVTAFPGGAPSPDSLLTGRVLVPSYQYRRHGRALQGGGLVLAFNEPFRADATLELGADLYIIEDGLRLGSSGPGEPLLWVNDLDPAVLAEGAGMMPSGVSVFYLPLWSVQQFYVFDVGSAGMMPSGVSITFSNQLDYFTYNLALIGQTFATFGSALLDATHPPFALLAIDHLAP